MPFGPPPGGPGACAAGGARTLVAAQKAQAAAEKSRGESDDDAPQMPSGTRTSVLTHRRQVFEQIVYVEGPHHNGAFLLRGGRVTDTSNLKNKCLSSDPEA